MKVMVMFSKFDIRVSYKIYIIRPKLDWKHSGRFLLESQVNPLNFVDWLQSSVSIRSKTFNLLHVNTTKRNNLGDLTWTLNPLHINRALIWTSLAWGIERSGGMVGWFTVEWSWKETGNKTIEFFYSFRDPELMKNAAKYVQIDNTAWYPLCEVRFIIRTTLISLGNIWNSLVNF